MVPIKHTVAFKDGPMLITQTILDDIDKIIDIKDIIEEDDEDDEDAINK